jgi:hypothetical protein
MTASYLNATGITDGYVLTSTGQVAQWSASAGGSPTGNPGSTGDLDPTVAYPSPVLRPYLKKRGGRLSGTRIDPFIKEDAATSVAFVATGQMFLVYFIPDYSVTAGFLGFSSASTPITQITTGTFCLALYTINGSGDLTLAANSLNDSTSVIGARTKYAAAIAQVNTTGTMAAGTTYTLVAGSSYGLGIFYLQSGGAGSYAGKSLLAAAIGDIGTAGASGGKIGQIYTYTTNNQLPPGGATNGNAPATILHSDGSFGTIASGSAVPWICAATTSGLT